MLLLVVHVSSEGEGILVFRMGKCHGDSCYIGRSPHGVLAQ
jgi:hypothetical protein